LYLNVQAVDKQEGRFDNGKIDNHFQEVWSLSKESQTLNASKNMRLTKGSQKVLEALASNRNLATAQDIHGKLREKNEEAPGLTTVYRSLESLVGLGLVQSVEFGDGEKRFEIVEPGEHHHHLVCEKCGDSVHLDQCLVEDLESAVKTKYGFEIRTHILEIFGLCKKCHSSK
jgi:Fur family ferric uptake transcriptional regulator